MRAFVTGITGQDGSYLAERLLAEGVTVHGLVQSLAEAAPFAERYPALVLHEGDLTDPAAVAALIDRTEPDEVYNLAGISSVALSWQRPVLTGQVTGVGAVGVMRACLDLQERLGRPVRMLQASSAEIFGEPAESPQRETTPLRPATPYGAAKAYAHQVAGMLRGRGLPVATVILYNHESPRRPETFVTRKITAAAARIAAGTQDRLALGNLAARRDWGWAPDYVEAMVRAIRHPEPDDYVIATGVSHTVADFVEAAFTAAGVADWRSRVDVDESFVRAGDAAEQRGDATRAREVLGWAPSRDFAGIVAAMVEADAVRG
ncbi:MAG TPA: GDP-mannose 4,6-dehydratase [Jatrophihabitans sp.]|nr:GDP-mannose 4,6-dehydratase [Jatrophihabitans sp.]